MLQKRHYLNSSRLRLDGTIDEESEEEFAEYLDDLSARLWCRNCGTVARGEWWRGEDGKLRFRPASWRKGFEPDGFSSPPEPARRPHLRPTRLPF